MVRQLVDQDSPRDGVDRQMVGGEEEAVRLGRVAAEEQAARGMILDHPPCPSSRNVGFGRLDRPVVRDLSLEDRLLHPEIDGRWHRTDLRRIQASQRHLLGLINEILNYARIETGTLRYDITDVPVREALIAAETLVGPQAREKGIAFAVGDCSPELAVRADSEKLRQIQGLE